MTDLISIQNWHAWVGETEIVRDFNLNIKKGEIHALMGPNGSGKSTLAFSLLGHPHYRVPSGKFLFKGVDITNETVDQKAKRGVFLSFQYPAAISGVSVGNFLRKAAEAQGQSPSSNFRKEVYRNLEKINLKKEFSTRSVNDGFSGGEKKRFELVQVNILKPTFVIFDEIDSGLDVDGLRSIISTIREYCTNQRSILLVTHYPQVLKLLKPHYVHVMTHGTILETGGHELAEHVEEKGYTSLRRK